MESVRPIAVDLFAGAGGLSLGFEQAGYEVAAAVELDPIHAAVHEFNFPNGKTFCASVVDITGDMLREGSAIGSREVAVVVGGAPCQGFSMIGQRALDDPRNSLVLEFARIVLELQPSHFVLENVAGLTVGKHKRFLEEIIELFEDGGYQVERSYQVLQAAEFGTPQSRKRLFLLGARADVKLPPYPAPITQTRPLNPERPTRQVATQKALFDIGCSLSPSVGDAIGDIPNADDFPDLLHSDSVQATFGEPSTYAAFLRGLNREEGDFSNPRPTNDNWLTASMRTKHTPKSIARFAETRPGLVEPISRFLRLHPEGVCNTLRAGTASDRGAFTSPRPVHPVHPRCITVREAARLHGYPDWFRFHVTKWHGFRQIGNSVPPPLARAVGAELMSALEIDPAMGEGHNPGNPELLTLTPQTAAELFGVHKHVIAPRRRRTDG